MVRVPGLMLALGTCTIERLFPAFNREEAALARHLSSEQEDGGRDAARPPASGRFWRRFAVRPS